MQKYVQWIIPRDTKLCGVRKRDIRGNWVHRCGFVYGCESCIWLLLWVVGTLMRNKARTTTNTTAENNLLSLFPILFSWVTAFSWGLRGLAQGMDYTISGVRQRKCTYKETHDWVFKKKSTMQQPAPTPSPPLPNHPATSSNYIFNSLRPGLPAS